MNWKKALLITVVGLFALVFFVVAAAGLVATAAVGAAAVTISESGVVQAFEEVAADARLLQIRVDDNSISFTDVNSLPSRVVGPNVELPDGLRAPQVVWDNDNDWVYYGPEHGLRLVGGIFRGLFNLAALTLVVVGVYLLVRYRRRAQAEAEVIDYDMTGKAS